MALSFPLDAATFFDRLCIDRVTFDDPENVETSITGGGEVLTQELAPRLWRGSVLIHNLPHARAQEIKALISTLRTPSRAFFLYHQHRKAPLLDPGGATLGASTVQILALNANNRELSLKGLPAGYELSAGDFLAFDYGSSPTRHALHRLVAGVTADGAGDTAEVEVVPNIRPGAAVDAAVSLVKPALKAKLVPGSFEPGTERKRWVTGMRFDWIQTLR